MLSEILTEEMIVCDVEVSTWREAVVAVGEVLVNKNKVKQDFIRSMIEVIEEFGPYMILVPEIAFFHGKPGPNVYEPCLSLIVLKEPVFFSEYDNQKITCAIGFGAIDNESHLKMLMNLSELLQDQKFVDAVTNNGCKNDILEIIKKY
jgi:PTS system ascorbate-specific IIA component